MDRVTQIRNWIKSADVNSPDHRWGLLKALRIVYSNQTQTEQSYGVTMEYNGRGFNGADARFGSILVNAGNKYGNLTIRQAEIAKRMMQKYARQIAEATELRTTSA